MGKKGADSRAGSKGAGLAGGRIKLGSRRGRERNRGGEGEREEESAKGGRNSPRVSLSIFPWETKRPACLHGKTVRLAPITRGFLSSALVVVLCGNLKISSLNEEP